jgi:hypothetical protein
MTVANTPIMSSEWMQDSRRCRRGLGIAKSSVGKVQHGGESIRPVAFTVEPAVIPTILTCLGRVLKPPRVVAAIAKNNSI